jgi:hypothetical protein
MVGEEVGYQGMIVGGVCVEFGEEDFSHVRQCSCVDFNGIALFVGVIEKFTLHHHFAQLEANIFGDPSRFVGISFKCPALLNPQGRLQRYDNAHDAGQ